MSMDGLYAEKSQGGRLGDVHGWTVCWKEPGMAIQPMSMDGRYAAKSRGRRCVQEWTVCEKLKINMTNTKTKQTGAAQTLEILQQLGIKDIFGYPGGAIMPMYDAIYASSINHYLCRHEQGCAFAAVGYARASGQVGVCMATSGPGATNLITGLADAMADSVPIIAITGQVPTRTMGTDGFQEVDIISLSLACTKHSFQIRNVSELPGVIHEAFKIATSGRPGPVLIDIPKDIQVAQVEQAYKSVIADTVPSKSALSNSASQIQHLDNNFNDATHLIAQSKKPLLYIGGGVGMADAVNELRQLMQLTQIPSVATLKGLGSVSLDEPHYLGMLGMHGSKAGNLAIQNCDLMIVLGARFDDRATGKLDAFAPNAKVIHMDIDPAEINKRRLAEVSLQGNLNATIPELINRFSGQANLVNPTDLQRWQKTCHGFEDKDEHYRENDYQGILAPHLLKKLSDRLQEEGKNPATVKRSYITTDVGQHQMWAAQHMRYHLPNRFISSSGLGTMGFGVPAAIGAQIYDPDATIICISGDGSFMMNVQELATIKRYQLPVKILLIDNSKLGLVRQWQQLFFEQRYSETDLSDNPDFVILAKAFDISGEMINDKMQVSDALERMLNSEGAYLLHVKIDSSENVWPLVPPDTANDKMMDQNDPKVQEIEKLNGETAGEKHA